MAIAQPPGPARKRTVGIGAALLFLAAQAATAQTWGTAQFLGDPADNAGAQKDPVICPAATGGFHAMYRYHAPDAVKFKYRRHTGTSLLPVKQVHSVGFGAGGDICEAGNGDIHMVWENWDSTPDIGWTMSSDGGNTFLPATEITNFTDVGKIPLVAPFGAANSPEVVMSCGKASSKQIWYNRFNGTTWAGYGAGTGLSYGSEYEIFGICRSLQDGSVFRVSDWGAVLAYQRYDGVSWTTTQVDNTGDFFPRQSIAVNPVGQIMVTWEQDDSLYSKLYTPGVGWGPRTLVRTGGQGAVTAIPGTNDFYIVYTRDRKDVRGKRWSGSGWFAEEIVSNG